MFTSGTDPTPTPREAIGSMEWNNGFSREVREALCEILRSMPKKDQDPPPHDEISWIHPCTHASTAKCGFIYYCIIDDINKLADIISMIKLCCSAYHQEDFSQCMRFPTMWYVRPAKPQISMRIWAV